jgi:hypothetical protein
LPTFCRHAAQLPWLMALANTSAASFCQPGIRCP